MPLDGSYLANEPYRIIEIPDQPVSAAQPRRRKIKWFRIFVVMFVLWAVSPEGRAVNLGEAMVDIREMQA